MQASSAVPPATRERPRPAGPRPATRSAVRWLAAVAAGFTIVQLLLVVPGSGLGWDETVYVSQVSPHAPAAYFSAPRARGVTLLVAPVTALTSSTEALRIHLALLSGTGLFLSLWVWRRLLPVPVLATAGGLFATLWITVFYGPQVMPNLWVAFGALAAVGLFLRAAEAGQRPAHAGAADRGALPGLGVAVGFVALLRPLDAVWLALPLAAAALSVRAWRRPLLFTVLASGAALGCADWLTEAYVRFGGPLARLDRASEIQGRLGWHPSFDDHARALAGRSLCRPCDMPWRHPAASVWWLALPLLTALGLHAAARHRQLRPTLLSALTGLSLAAPYLLLTDYAAPRFLLPTYALLALPVAQLFVRAVQDARPRLRLLVVAVIAIALVGHLAVQYQILAGAVARNRSDRKAYERIAATLHRQGLRPPCLVTGDEAIRVAFHARCASRQPSGHDASITTAALQAAAAARPAAVLVAGSNQPPQYAQSWRLQPLPTPGKLRNYRAYLAPSAHPTP
jgi:hypothetical protein